MVSILGISAFYHDSAAALVVDGDLVAAAQEERFTRKKHDPGFPSKAIEYCLQEGNVQLDELDYIAFYDKPLTKFERLLETYLAFAPSGLRSFAMAIPVWIENKLNLRRTIRKSLEGATKAKILFLEHHESHAASAFFPSPYEEAAILTLDGVGEWSTTTYGVGSGNRIDLTHHIQFPHSIGLLYSAFTYYCGFKVNSGEYKLMGLAPYGKPIYEDLILRELIDLKPDGSFWLNMKYFNYCQGLTMTNEHFDKLFGAPPRAPESSIGQLHLDMAASVQAVTEKAIMHIADHLHKTTKQKNLVLAGGVALNCVANGKLLREGPFENIWVQPAAGDAGGALGAALFVWHQLLENPRQTSVPDSQKGSLLGPDLDNIEIERFLEESKVEYEHHANESELLKQTARLLADEKVVGWCNGRMEFGPRSLGARSILGDPRSKKMQTTMNVKIKFRESFRPFAPCVLQDHVHEWFDMQPGQESPYMLMVAPVLEQHRSEIASEDLERMQTSPNLVERVTVARSTIPAVTHVDYSARVQTVDEIRNPRFHGLLQEFYAQTGCPVLVNTSFNVRGEPIVCTPQDAYRCFLTTDMDALVLGNYIIRKEKLKPTALVGAADRQKHLAQFQLD